MSKQIRRRVFSAMVFLAMAAPVVLVAPVHAYVTPNQTGTDPEPTDPGVMLTTVIPMALAIQ